MQRGRYDCGVGGGGGGGGGGANREMSRPSRTSNFLAERMKEQEAKVMIELSLHSKNPSRQRRDRKNRWTRAGMEKKRRGSVARGRPQNRGLR